MRNFFAFLLTVLICSALQAQPTLMARAKQIKSSMSDYPPGWSYNANIYEVNLRQYTKSGTIREFMPHLDRLSKMGVKILWFMPIQPIGVKGRKGSLGSYYSIKDYLAVNPEHGTTEEWIQLVDKAHALGMKVILDWVANHTSNDHAWITSHPEYYTKDSTGKIIPPVADWLDVADLNYDNKEMRQAMIESMKYWVRATNIDGFRCDVAEMVPTDFWPDARRQLEMERKGLFMLAEGEKPELHEKAFDMGYTWSLFHPMNEIAIGKKNAKAIDEALASKASFPPNAFRMYFTNNHDENSWNGSNWEKMGEASKAFAVLTFGLNGMPLIYSGQEADNRRRLSFFEKDSIDWKDYPLQDFYTRLLSLKNNEAALSHGETGGTFTKIPTSNDENIYAFKREKEKSKVVFILNLSAKKQKVKINSEEIAGNCVEVFSPQNVTFNLDSKQNISMEPWTYLVYRYNN